MQFAPNLKVNGREIGFVQMATSRHGSQPFTLDNNPTIAARSIPAGRPGAGTHIDNHPSSTDPLFDMASPDQGKRIGQAAGYGNAAVTEDSPQHLVSNPWMRDTPHLPHHVPGDSQSFETSVVATGGEQQGSYYGTVRWGWYANESNQVIRIPATLVSADVPGATFMAAADQWGQAKNDNGQPDLPLPTAQAKLVRAGGADLVAEDGNPKARKWRLAQDTRVELTSTPEPFNEDARGPAQLRRVTVVDGPHAGTVGFVSIARLSDP
jgi:hypothetical protein